MVAMIGFLHLHYNIKTTIYNLVHLYAGTVVYQYREIGMEMRW
jgi:hypothetical protein